MARRIYDSTMGSVLFVIAALAFVGGVIVIFTRSVWVGLGIALVSFFAVQVINVRYAKRDTPGGE